MLMFCFVTILRGAQAGFEPFIFVPTSPRWNYRHVPPRPQCLLLMKGVGSFSRERKRSGEEADALQVHVNLQESS